MLQLSAEVHALFFYSSIVLVFFMYFGKIVFEIFRIYVLYVREFNYFKTGRQFLIIHRICKASILGCELRYLVEDTVSVVYLRKCWLERPKSLYFDIFQSLKHPATSNGSTFASS